MAVQESPQSRLAARRQPYVSPGELVTAGVAVLAAYSIVLALFMAYRTFKVAHVGLRGQTAVVAAPWGGVVSYRAGGAVFLVVTLVALVLVGRAAWAAEEA